MTSWKRWIAALLAGLVIALGACSNNPEVDQPGDPEQVEEVEEELHELEEAKHRTQYFEILGGRAIYHDGWRAVRAERRERRRSSRTERRSDRSTWM